MVNKQDVENTDCTYGTVTRQRLIAVEEWMGILSRMVFWLFAASFTTLGAAVVSLIMMLVDRSK